MTHRNDTDRTPLLPAPARRPNLDSSPDPCLDTNPDLVQRIRRRHAVRITEGLLSALHIHPEGIDLVVWLADSRSRNNRAALVFWVDQRLQDPTAWNQDQPDALAIFDQLVRLLDRIEDSCP